MKRILVALFVVLFGVVSNLSAASDFVKKYIGEKPEKWTYLSLGYFSETVGDTGFTFGDPENNAEGVFNSLHSWMEISQTPQSGSLPGLAIKLGVNITNKIFAEVSSTPWEVRTAVTTNFPWVYDAGTGQTHVIGQTFVLRDIQIKNSPEVSFNYSALDLSGFKFYLGFGFKRVYVEGETMATPIPSDRNYRTYVEGGESKTTLRLGMKFPIKKFVSGSLDYSYCPVTVISDFQPFGEFRTAFAGSNIQLSVGMSVW